MIMTTFNASLAEIIDCLRCGTSDRTSRRHMKATRFLFAFHLETSMKVHAV